MYDYIIGTVQELTPTDITLEANGIGYKVSISLNSFSSLKEGEKAKLFIYHHLREDSETLFGFIEKSERTLFTQLIGVSGIGPATGRVMISSMSVDELSVAIASGDVNKLKSIKGIGVKTAQRIIIDLKDKIGKSGGDGKMAALVGAATPTLKTKEEAATALLLLGFTKPNIEKVLSALLKESSSYSLEELIKLALKRL